MRAYAVNLIMKTQNRGYFYKLHEETD